MPGKGPVPKRSDQRRRRNKPDGVQTVRATAGAEITWPEAPADWPALITELYESLPVSGQAQFYEQSDVALARVALDGLATTVNSGKINGQLWSAAMSALGNLGVTEGDRRRMRIELERAAGEDQAELAAVADFEAYQRKLGG